MDYSPIKKKIIITGSNSRFAKALRKSFFGKNIIYTDRKQLNILDLKSIERCLEKYKPKYLIHLASLSRPMIVHEEDINSSIDANIIGTANVVKKCSDRNIKLIYFSTNYIYPGNKGNYHEDHPIKPVNNYAWSKLGGESSVKLYKNSLILRLAMTEYPFIHDKAFKDAKTNFLYREEVIKILPKLLDQTGIINIGSDITESFYSFAKKTKKDVKPISVKNIKNFPINSSVNVNKLKSILNKYNNKITDRKNLKNIFNKRKDIFLNSGPSVTQIEREIIDDMMRFGWDNLSFVEKFEYEFAKYHKRKYCLMTPSIGIAFHLAIKITNIKKGSEIIIPDFSNTNFLSQIIQMGLKPIIVNVSNEDLVINKNSLKKSFSKKTKAIVCNDLYGNIPNFLEIKKICKKKLTIFEDASDALGQKFKNILAGKFGDISFHDFSKDKTITCGEGGAILTDNKSFYLKAKKLRDINNQDHDIKSYQENSSLCFMPSNLQGAMVYGQFKRLNYLTKRNKYLFNEYNKNFKNLDIKLMGSRAIVMKFNKKYKINISSLVNYLNRNKIYAKKIKKPISLHKFFKNNKKFNNSKNIYENSIILPSHYNLNSLDINFISEKIKSFIKKYS